ncbi:hypothetical protein [Tabrizicola sp.]
MDGNHQRPVASPPHAVAQSAPHRILVCKACKPGIVVTAKGAIQ